MNNFAGFGIRGYKSYGGDSVEIVGPMDNIHLLVGKNDVGKSNTLRTMLDIISLFRAQLHRVAKLDRNIATFNSKDTPDGWQSEAPRVVSLGVRVNGVTMSPFSKQLEERDPSQDDILNLFATKAYSRGNPDIVWLDFEIIPHPTESNFSQAALSESQFDTGLSELAANNNLAKWLISTHNALLSSHSPSERSIEYLRDLVGLLDFGNIIPEPKSVVAVREITVRDPNRSGHRPFSDGRGLVDELWSLDRPDDDGYDDNKAKFNALKDFVRSVLDDPTADIEVAATKSNLWVFLHGKRKSVWDLGTGISEVVIIAAAATTSRSKLICIEEPELHLHPTLQRKLLKYLSEDTENRYLMSTHSASMLDAKLSSISHITKDADGWSHISPVASKSTLSSAVTDLGSRASDVVQSNFVVWVEGPADRIYIEHWISKFTSGELVVDVDYSIMFYGGAMLNHLSVDDQEVNKFIKLAMINRNLAIVIDSDKKTDEQELNSTKRRVLDELVEYGAQGWVTDGYTIENYIPHEVLKKVIADAYPENKYELPNDNHISPLGKSFISKSFKPGKVAVARAVVAANLSFTDWPKHLQQQIATLVDGIQKANQ